MLEVSRSKETILVYREGIKEMSSYVHMMTTVNHRDIEPLIGTKCSRRDINVSKGDTLIMARCWYSNCLCASKSERRYALLRLVGGVAERLDKQMQTILARNSKKLIITTSNKPLQSTIHIIRESTDIDMRVVIVRLCM